MNSTPHSPDAAKAPAPHLEFRQLPVKELELPAGLFDPRDADPAAADDLPLPLTVYRTGRGYVIIDGCKRFIRARQTESGSVDCMVLVPAPDAVRAALLRMSLNRVRPLRFFEKLLFTAWLKEHCEEEQYSEMCTALSIDNRERRELEQLSSCDAETIDAVYRGTLERVLAPEVRRLDPADRTAVLLFTQKHPFSRQAQRELLDWLPELAYREKCPVADILALPEISAIEHNEKLNGPQKIDHLRTALFNRRFPTLSRAKKEWELLAAQCNPDPRRVQFKPAEAFEKNRLEVRISITTAEEAKTIFSQLGALEASQWNRLIYPAQRYR
jgi:hypothetical protein